MEGNLWIRLDREILNACQFIWGSEIYGVQSEIEMKMKQSRDVEWITALLLCSYWSIFPFEEIILFSPVCVIQLNNNTWLKMCPRSENGQKSDLKPFEVWWRAPINPDLETWRQEDFCRFGVILGEMMNSRWVYAMQGEYHKGKTRK